MKKLEDLSAKEFAELIKNKKPFELEIPESVLRFKIGFPTLDFSEEREIAPTYVDSELIALVLTHAAQGAEGRYTQVVAFVYASGGKIFYKQLTPDSYVANVRW